MWDWQAHSLWGRRAAGFAVRMEHAMRPLRSACPYLGTMCVPAADPALSSAGVPAHEERGPGALPAPGAAAWQDVLRGARCVQRQYKGEASRRHCPRAVAGRGRREGQRESMALAFRCCAPTLVHTFLCWEVSTVPPSLHTSSHHIVAGGVYSASQPSHGSHWPGAQVVSGRAGGWGLKWRERAGG